MSFFAIEMRWLWGLFSIEMLYTISYDKVHPTWPRLRAIEVDSQYHLVERAIYVKAYFYAWRFDGWLRYDQILGSQIVD